jgi:hypothetical protein
MAAASDRAHIDYGQHLAAFGEPDPRSEHGPYAEPRDDSVGRDISRPSPEIRNAR